MSKFRIIGLLFSGASLAPSTIAQGATQSQVLAAFNGLSRGANPVSGLVADAGGNLYGTTQGGGRFGYGTVFKLAPPVNGGTAWIESVLYNFSGLNDGGEPKSQLTIDSAGNLFGITGAGGSLRNGTIFKLTPPPTGKSGWKFVTIHTYDPAVDCCMTDRLILDQSGRLYGAGWQTVYRLDPPSAGQSAWTETILYTFNGSGSALSSVGGLLMDSAGNLYGVARYGGLDSGQGGGVFMLSPPSGGQTPWLEKDLYLFGTQSTDPEEPIGNLAADSAGNLYGVTPGEVIGFSSGAAPYGSVFKLTQPSPGQTQWTETVLYSFLGQAWGQFPLSGVTLDSAGNVYGTTSGTSIFTGRGGPPYGTVFKLSPPKLGQSVWTETTLLSPFGTIGEYPEGELLLDNAGDVIGTTAGGGKYGFGTVFKITPR